MRGDVIPKPAEEWKHFQGTVYTVVGLARDCQNQEIQVVYFHEQEMWVRSLSSWTSLVRNRVLENGLDYSGPRFVRVCPAVRTAKKGEDAE